MQILLHVDVSQEGFLLEFLVSLGGFCPGFFFGVKISMLLMAFLVSEGWAEEMLHFLS